MDFIIIIPATLMIFLLLIGTPVPVALGFAGMAGLYAAHRRMGRWWSRQRFYLTPSMISFCLQSHCSS